MSPTSPDDSLSTLADLEPGTRRRLDDGFRWFFIGLVIVVIALGLIGLLGPRRSTAAVANEGLELSVRYDSITRPGLAATWAVTITSRDGRPLPTEVEVTSTSSYFDMFDENGFSPEPVSETAGADETTWIFEPEPDSNTLAISLDARTQPSWRMPVTGRTTVSVADRDPLSASYRTVVLP